MKELVKSLISIPYLIILGALGIVAIVLMWPLVILGVAGEWADAKFEATMVVGVVTTIMWVGYFLWLLDGIYFGGGG